MGGFRGPVVMLDPGNFSPQYTANLCSSLAQSSVDVTLITSPPQFGEMPSPIGYRIERFFFRHVSGSGLLRSMIARKAPARLVLKACAYPFGLARTKQLLRSAKSPGILHYQWAHMPILDALLVAKFKDAGWGTVATVHDFTVPAPFSALWKRQAQPFFRSADSVIVHTERLADQTNSDFGIPRSRIHVIARGGLGSLRGSPLSREEARARIGIGGSGPVLLHFGMIKPNKGLAHLLHAMTEILRAYPDTRLLIAGEPVENFDVYAALIAQLGIQQSVLARLGYVRDEDVGAHFQAADLVVLPHTAISLSGVAWVALEFGRPIVGTNVGGLPDLIEEGVNGLLVPPGSSEALSRAIIRMLGDSEQLECMGERARARFEAQHSWTKAANQTLQLYTRLMSKASGSERPDHS